MKTLSLFNIKNISTILLVVLAFVITSCGSYHNSSYYDSDGIYSNTEEYASRNVSNEANHNTTGSYFTQFQDYHVSEEPVGIFTDVDSYYGNDQEYSTGYSGWGNSVSNVSVNVYGGLGWYGNWGWGNWYWNSWYYPYWGWSSWYSPYWGWNSWHNPYWGWNNGWGGYYPYYGGYTYHRGPRGVYSSDYAYRSRTMSSAAGRGVSQNRAYEVRGRNENGTATRSNSRFTTNSTRSNTIQSTRGTNSTRNSSIDNRATRNSTINNSRSNTNTRSNTINNNKNTNSGNRSGNFNTNRSSNTSPSMNRGGSSSGRSSGMGSGGGSTRSSSGGRR